MIGRAARAQRRLEKRLEAAVGGEAEEAPPEPEPGPAPEPEWLPIEGIFLAVAVDGAGHHDGSSAGNDGRAEHHDDSVTVTPRSAWLRGQLG